MTFSANYAASCYGSIPYGVRVTTSYTASLSEGVTSADSPAINTTFSTTINNAMTSGDPLSMLLHVMEPMAIAAKVQELGIGRPLIPMQTFNANDEKRDADPFTEKRTDKQNADDRVRSVPDDRKSEAVENRNFTV